MTSHSTLTASDLDAEALAILAAGGESEQLEFKKSTSQQKEAARALCGMLNGRGGQVLFGIAENGAVLGQQVADQTLTQLAEVFKHVEPPIQPHIDRIAVGNAREVLAVTVRAGEYMPYLYRGIAYRRVGATTQKMTWEEQQRLLLERVHGLKRWELEESPLQLDDLDLPLMTEAINEGIRRGRIPEPPDRDPRLVLLGLGLLSALGNLTNASAVLFGHSRQLQTHYPQCLVRLALFSGTTTDQLVEVRHVHDNAFGLIISSERFLASNLRIRSEIRADQPDRLDVPEIPIRALREAIANAVAHREYHHASGSIMLAIFDDRVEISSVGGLHFGLLAEQLYKPHKAQPWNPHIAQMLYRRGIVDSVGTGTTRMVTMVREYGLPIPVIQDTGQSVDVTFTRPGHVPGLLAEYGLTSNEFRIIEALAARITASRSSIASLPALTDRSTRRLLEQLRAHGLVDYTERGPAAQWHLIGDALRAYPRHSQD